MEKEIWKDIIDYEGMYQISSYGQVKSLALMLQSGFRGFAMSEDRILKHGIDKDGYALYGLSKDNKRKTYKGHRLVAIHFIDNTDNLPVVNHIDGIKTNNYYRNIEWCTVVYNNNHMITTGLKTNNKFVGKYSLDDKLLDVYYSCREATRENNFRGSGISRAANGHLITAHKFKWKFITKEVFENNGGKRKPVNPEYTKMRKEIKMKKKGRKI